MDAVVLGGIRTQICFREHIIQSLAHMHGSALVLRLCSKKPSCKSTLAQGVFYIERCGDVVMLSTNFVGGNHNPPAHIKAEIATELADHVSYHLAASKGAQLCQQNM